MKIDLLNIDQLVAVNSLEQITSRFIYANKGEFHPDGIMSNDIFGISNHDRRFTFAYIDLNKHYIHPYVYGHVLKPIFRGSLGIISGIERYSIQNGVPVKDDNGWTGIDELYKHWKEIDWRKFKSANKDAINILSKKPIDEIFITKFPVCPPVPYRDVRTGADVDPSDRTNPLNKLYQRLIQFVSLSKISAMTMKFQQYATEQSIEDTLLQLYEYFISRIEKKFGLIKRSLMGKSIDYGVRTVISAPVAKEDKMEDNMVDMDHCALPLAHALVTFKPFIVSYLKDFFTRELINRADAYIAKGVDKYQYVKLYNPDIQFSDKAIEKLISNYIYNPDSRFDDVIVDFVNPKNKDEILHTPLFIKGREFLSDSSSKELYRVMTVTDILYIAAVDSCEKRHVMLSRYPVGTDKGIFFNKVRVQSTTDHIRVTYNGKEYPFYPKIDKNSGEEIKVLFQDTTSFSNSYLDGAGGDYDGDQMSVRGIWSDEANTEADKIMNSKFSALTVTGSNIRQLKKELFNTLYELTKDGNGKQISQKDTAEILSLRTSDLGRDKMFDLFAAKFVNGVRKPPRFNTFDKISIPSDRYTGAAHTTIHTTIGRYIVNTYMFESSGILEIIGFQDCVMNGKQVSRYDELVGDLLLNDKINHKQFNEYIDRRDFIGLQMNGPLAHTISPKMAKPLPSVEKYKAELLEQHKDEIANGNIDVMKDIENKLIAKAKEELKDDPGMELYNSGDLNFENNYKNNSIIKGPVPNKLDGGFDFISSSFMDGIEIKDQPAHANSVVASVYPSAIKTGTAGYLAKKLLMVLQMVTIDEPDTDCGTKRTIPITITKQNASAMSYKYFVDDSGKLEQITPNNVNQYIGRTLNFRSPMSCTSEKICSKCASELFYKLGIRNIGLTSVALSHADLNLNLKAKHDATIHLYDIDLNNIAV